jgi:phospholipid-binding lipoprotein MlaA
VKLVRRASSVLALLAGLALLGLSGCASVAPSDAKRDPWERMNRAVFGFNEGLDKAIVKPAATGYRAVLPEFVRTGVDNVLGNATDAWSAANHLLQGKFQPAVEMTMRVAVNSTFGLFGVLDIATEARLERQTEDFGQTLGRWGLGTGPYLVLPVLGPSTVRDGLAKPLDLAASPPQLLFNQTRKVNTTTAVQLVNARASLLGATRALDEAALDKYILVRDGYLARRRNQVYDGDPPEEGSPANNPK